MESDTKNREKRKGVTIMTSMNFGDITKHILNNLGGDIKKLDGYTAGGGTGTTDGVVSLAEFSNYFKDELGSDFNANKDIITKFFNQLNTNKVSANRLDEKELENADKTFQIYNAVETKIEELDLDANAPSGLSGALTESWKKSVEDEIFALIDKNMKLATKNEDGSYNVDSILTPAVLNSIQNKQAVLCYQTELESSLKDEMLSDYPDYKPADDKEIDKIINLYIKSESNNWTESTNFDGIKEDLEALIREYINLALDPNAKPEVGEDGKPVQTGLQQLGYTPSGLNDLQVEVAKKELKESLLEHYDSQADQKVINKVLDKFIQTQVEKAGDFATFMQQIENIGEEGGLDLTTLELLFEAENWRDFSIYTDGTNKTDEENTKTETTIYAKVKAKVGEDLAKVIAENERYIKEYGKAIDEAVKKIEAGEITTQAEFEEFVLEKIMQNLSKFLDGVGSNDMDVTELGALYDQLSASADAMADDDASLKLHREAALTYCDAIAKKGEAFKKEIEKVFGTTDYKSEINKALPSKIKELIAELKEAVKDIKVVENNNADSIKETDTAKTATWSGLESEYTVAVGQSIPMFKASATYGDNKTAVDTYAIDVDGTADVKIDALGNITVTGSKEPGVTKVTIYAIVDGKKIGGEKTFTIKSEPAEMIKEDDISNDATLNGISGAVYGGWSGKGKLGAALAGGIAAVTDFINGLTPSGEYNSEKISATKKTTISYFTALINALYDDSTNYKDYTKSASFKYTDANGKEQSASANFRLIQDDTRNGATGYANSETQWGDQSGVALKSAIYAGKGNANDLFEVQIDKRKIVQKFMEFYKSIQ